MAISLRRDGPGAGAARSPRRRRAPPPPSPTTRRRTTFARVAVGAVGEQRLAEPALVVGDEVRGGAEDVRGRAVVALEADHGGAGKILLEAEDVVDLGAAPAVDRLVVVADAADVLASLGEQPQPEILRDVGVLVLVDQHVAEALVVVGEHVRMLAKDLQRLEDEVAEIGGVERLQPLLVGGVELPPAAVGKGVGVGFRHVLRRKPAVLPGVDPARELARRPALLVDALGLDDLLHQADLVVGVEDGEAGLEAGQLGVAPEQLARRSNGRCRATACLRARRRSGRRRGSSSPAPPCW